MFGIAEISIFGKSVHLWLAANLLGYLAFIVYVFFGVTRMQKKEFLCPGLQQKYRYKNAAERKKGIFAEAAVISLISAVSSILMNQLFGICFGPIRNNFFGVVVFAPLLIALLCIPAGISTMRLTDKIIPAFSLLYCFSNIANYFDGSCAGKFWENGIYNKAYGETQHPAPLYALAFALLIFLITVILSKKSKKAGLSYPLFVILYSATRLITQFFRVDNVGTVGKLPVYTFQCIVFTVVGIIFLAVILRYGSRVEAAQQNNVAENERKKH